MEHHKTENLLYGKSHHRPDKAAVYKMGEYFNNSTSSNRLMFKLYKELINRDVTKNDPLENEVQV